MPVLQEKSERELLVMEIYQEYLSLTEEQKSLFEKMLRHLVNGQSSG